MMGSEPLWQPFSRRRRARGRGWTQVARRFGLEVDPDALVGNLSVGERQRVEILKALYRGARILILDEPTAVLTPRESEALFDGAGADGGAGPVHHLHQPQAGRGAARVEPGRGAARAASWWPRPPLPRTTPGAAGPVDGRPCGRRAAARGRPEPSAKPVCALDAGQRRQRPRTAGRRCRWNCAPARSSPSPASPATARPRWPNCCAARAQPPAAACACSASRMPAQPGAAGGAGRGAHSGRPPCGRRRRRPAGLGKRRVRAPAQPRSSRARRGSGARKAHAHAQRVIDALRRARRRRRSAGARLVGRQHAKADPGPRPAAPGQQRRAHRSRRG